MKKNIIILLLSTSVLLSAEKMKINPNPYKNLYENMLETKLEEEIFSKMEDVYAYTDFLIKNFNLNKEKKDYSISIHEENEDWMIFIIFEEKSEEIIYDKLDDYFDYILIISKADGKIKCFKHNNI